MADKEINTNGGTFIGEDVNTNGGDFIGRDKTNTRTNTGNTTTTSNTHFSGNFLVAVIAVLVVGIIATIAILSNGIVKSQLSPPSDLVSTITLDNTRPQSIFINTPKTTDTSIASGSASVSPTLTVTPSPISTLTPDQQATASAETVTAQAHETATAQMKTTVSAEATLTRIAQAQETETAISLPQARAEIAAKAIADALSTPLPQKLKSLHDRFGFNFVHIPAGEFQMGSTQQEIDDALLLCNRYNNNSCQRQWFDNETPLHPVSVNEFWISMTEVTNDQYHFFVKARGYEQDKFWPHGEIGRSDLYGIGPRRSVPSCWSFLGAPLDFSGDEPISCLTWFEANAYLRWLDEESGIEVHMPTEAEWEFAARGQERRIFPWGNEWDVTQENLRLNYCDSGCETKWKDKNVNDHFNYVAPVNSFMLGVTPEGVLNLAGNVAELTSTIYRSYSYIPNPLVNDDPSFDHVVRGGSWNHPPYLVRAASREADTIEQIYGFRIAVTLH